MIPFWKRTLIIVALITGFLACLDFGLEVALNRSGFVNEVVDIQTPSILLAKINYLREFDGYKIVMIGDSLIYGATLLEHGDKDWREHILSSILRERITNTLDGRKVLIMNLGLNGALPADLERLVRIVLKQHVDLLIMDVNMRSFSMDFAPDSEMYSRRWLNRIDIDAKGWLHDTPPAAPVSARLENIIAAFATNTWSLYRFRDFYQWRVFRAQPRDWILSLRNRLNAEMLSQPANKTGKAEQDFMVLLLKSKRRYASVNLREDNPQRQALERTLRLLNDNKQKTLIFYAKENPKLVYKLINKDKYLALRAEVIQLIHNYSNDTLRFLGPVDELEDRVFLDQIHIDAEGYRILADKMWPTLQVLLTQL